MFFHEQFFPTFKKKDKVKINLNLKVCLRSQGCTKLEFLLQCLQRLIFSPKVEFLLQCLQRLIFSNSVSKDWFSLTVSPKVDFLLQCLQMLTFFYSVSKGWYSLQRLIFFYSVSKGWSSWWNREDWSEDKQLYTVNLPCLWSTITSDHMVQEQQTNPGKLHPL